MDEPVDVFAVSPEDESGDSEHEQDDRPVGMRPSEESEDEGGDGGGGCGGEAGDGDDFGLEEDEVPDHEGDDDGPECECDECSDAGGHSLSALEVEPAGVHVTEDASCGDEHCAPALSDGRSESDATADEQDGECALEEIEDEANSSVSCSEYASYVCRSDVVAAMFSDVDAVEPSDQVSEWDASCQVSAEQHEERTVDFW